MSAVAAAGGGGGGGVGRRKTIVGGGVGRRQSVSTGEPLKFLLDLDALLEHQKKLENDDSLQLTEAGKEMKRLISVKEMEALLDKIRKEEETRSGLTEALSKLKEAMESVKVLYVDFGQEKAIAEKKDEVKQKLVDFANTRFKTVGIQGSTSPLFDNMCQLILCFKNDYNDGAGSSYEGNARKYIEDSWTDGEEKKEFCAQPKMIDDLTDEVARLELFARTADTKSAFIAAKETVIAEFLAPRYSAFKEAMESGLADDSFLSENKHVTALTNACKNLSKEERRAVFEGTYVLAFGRANKKVEEVNK